MSDKPRDNWDKAAILLQPVGGLLTAIAVGLLGFWGSNYLKQRETNENIMRERLQANETNVRIYTELMSKREEAESALRKDMFNSIIGSFMHPGSTDLEEQVLNLELLSYNFHESLNLKPLFGYLYKRIDQQSGAQKIEYQMRLNKVAQEITRKQMLVLEAAGEKVDRAVELDSLRTYPGGFPLEEANLKIDGLERNFNILITGADQKTKLVKARLEIRTLDPVTEEVETNIAEFWVGFFDFPMIDNTRLSNDQRCAIVLNAFENSTVELTLVYFPGAYASLKEKPYYQEVVQNLLRTNQMTRQAEKNP
jgi:hypothetical protein